MKSYNVSTVSYVLDHMNPQGFDIYQRYFIGDYLFIIVFGVLQIMLTLYAYRWLNSKILLGLIIAVPLARGICDMIENTLLLYILHSYPTMQVTIINISAKLTFIKLKLIPTWILLFLIGIIITSIRRVQKKNTPIPHTQSNLR